MNSPRTRCVSRGGLPDAARVHVGVLRVAWTGAFGPRGRRAAHSTQIVETTRCRARRKACHGCTRSCDSGANSAVAASGSRLMKLAHLQGIHRRRGKYPRPLPAEQDDLRRSALRRRRPEPAVADRHHSTRRARAKSTAPPWSMCTCGASSAGRSPTIWCGARRRYARDGALAAPAPSRADGGALGPRYSGQVQGVVASCLWSSGDECRDPAKIYSRT